MTATPDINAVNDLVRRESAFVTPLLSEMETVVIGQRPLLERLLVGLLANGHLLLEGVPGLAKTLAVKTLAQALGADFARIQFTPDLLPADLVGTLVYNPKTGDFTTRKGPVFAHVVLADEINRAPAKVQSALLEAMQERQVTIGQETYPLPEAQVDRFMLKIKVDYPTLDQERLILDANARTTPPPAPRAVCTLDQIVAARAVVDQIYVDPKVKDYILSIVFATRDPETWKVPSLAGNLRYGASPRATLALTLAARAHAFLSGRGYVTPQDVKSIAPDVLRHRLVPSFEAEAENLTSETLVSTLLSELPVP